MSRIVIHPERLGVRAKVTLVEISAIDGIYTLLCTGDTIAAATKDESHSCPHAGFDPADGDTWSDLNDCIAAAEIHMAAHERRFCERCGADNSAPLVVRMSSGWMEEHIACTSCDHVEVLS